MQQRPALLHAILEEEKIKDQTLTKSHRHRYLYRNHRTHPLVKVGDLLTKVTVLPFWDLLISFLLQDREWSLSKVESLAWWFQWADAQLASRFLAVDVQHQVFDCPVSRDQAFRWGHSAMLACLNDPLGSCRCYRCNRYTLRTSFPMIF